MFTPNTPQQPQTTVMNYMGLVICGGLAIIGISQLFTNRFEDGIINIIIGSSLTSVFFPFDYNKAKTWQKSLIIIYTLAILVAFVFVLFNDFSK